MSFLHIARNINEYIKNNPDIKADYGMYAGMVLVQKAFRSPFFHVVNNSGRNAGFLAD